MGDEELLSQFPVYAILFTEPLWQAPCDPVVSEITSAGSGTFPHGLDRSVVPALRGLHFALRLPKSLRELADLPIAALLLGHTQERCHSFPPLCVRV